MDEPNAWTEDELRILREMWPCHTVREISERIPGRTPQACLTKGLRIGLPRRPHRGGKGEPWTPEEDEAIRACIPGMLALPSPDARLIALRRLSRAIGREERHVASRMRRWLREEAA